METMTAVPELLNDTHLGWVHTAVFESELDEVSTLFFGAEIFSVKKQPCEHTFRHGFHADFPRQSGFRVQFHLKKQRCEPSLTAPNDPH